MPNFDVYRQQWQKMQELPEFQQLQPQQQSKLQQRFFTKLVLADPEIKTAASADPKLIPQMHRAWYGPQEPTPFLGTAVGGGIADFLSMFTRESYKASAQQAGQGLAETAAAIGGFEGERLKRGLVETSRGVGGLVGPPVMAAVAPVVALAPAAGAATVATIGGVMTARYGMEKGLEKLEQSGYDYDRPLAELGIEALSWLVPSKTSKQMRQRIWKKLTERPAGPLPPPPAAAAPAIPAVEPPIAPPVLPTLSSFPEVGPEGIVPAAPYKRGPRNPASPADAMSMVPEGPDIMSSIPGMKTLPEMAEAEVPATSAPKKAARPDRPAAALPPPQPSLEARVTESPSVPKAPEPVAPAASPQRRLRDFGPPRGKVERRRELPARIGGPPPRRAQAAPLTMQPTAPEGVTPQLEASARAFLGVPKKAVEAPKVSRATAAPKPLKGTEILRLEATPEDGAAADISAFKERVEARFKEIGQALLSNEALSAKQKENASTRLLLRRNKIQQLLDEGKLLEAMEATKPAAGEVKAHLEAERAEAKRQRDRERMAAKRTVAGQEATPESFAVGDETRIERAAAEDAAQIQRRAAGSFTDVEAPPSEIVKAGNINELPEGELPPLEGAAAGVVDVPQLAAAKAEVRATAKKLGRHDAEIVELEKFVDTLVLLGRTPAAAAQEVAAGLGVVRAAKGSKGSKAAERTEERLRAREERTEEVELSKNFERVDDSGEAGFIGEREGGKPPSEYLKQDIKKLGTYFSTLYQTIRERLPASASAKQVFGTLRNAKGVSPEEMKWAGVRQFLEDKDARGEKVSRDELMRFMEENTVRIEETRLDKWDNTIPRTEINEGTRYGTWTLPGGTNYREVLLKLPYRKSGGNYVDPHWLGEENTVSWYRAQDHQTAAGEKTMYLQNLQSGWQKAAQGNLTPEKRAALQVDLDRHSELFNNKIRELKSKYLEAILKPEEGDPLATRGNFDLRKLEIETMRQVEETFGDNTWDYNRLAKILNNPVSTPEHKALVRRALEIDRDFTALDALEISMQDAQSRLAKGNVPDAPLLQDWLGLTLKRALREAAEKGYDRLTWATGEISNRIEHMPLKDAQKLYDKDIPEFLNKFGKQWGVGVENVAIQAGDYTSKGSFGPTPTVHSLPITPEMRAHVNREGFPLFGGTKSEFPRKGELGFVAGDLPMTLIKGILKIPGAIDQGLQGTYTKYLGGPAYEMAAALPERIFRSLSTLVGRPNSFERTFLPRSARLSPEYLAADRARVAAQDLWEVKGKKVALDLSKGLDRNSQQVLGKFMRGEFTQQELRRIRNDPQWQETVDNAKQAREYRDSLHHASFMQNMISAETYARNLNKYVPTFYREYVDYLQAKQQGASANHLRKMRLDLDRFRKERGLPLEVKMDLGWIEEPAYPVGKGLAQAGKALELNKFFSEVSKNPEWVKADVKEVPAGEIGDWLQLPKDIKLGALSGKYARKWLYDDLEVHRIAPGMIEAVLDAGLSEWKFTKVVMGTSPQIRNVYTNAILQFMGGLSPHRLDIYSRAFRDVWQNVHPKKGMTASASYEQARKHGLFGSGTTFTEAEMAGFIDSWNKSSGNLWQRMSQMGREFMDASVPEKARKVARVVTASKLGRMLEGKTVKGVTVDPARWYQINEHVFRYAKFLHNIEQKMTPDAAVADALKWSIDFSDMPPAVKWTGRLSSPFIAFPAGALPRFGEATLKYPWRVMLGMAILEEAEKRSKVALGMSDEEHEQIEKSLPRRLQSPMEFPARQMAQRGLSLVPGMPESAAQYGGKLAGQIFTRSHLLRWREQGTGRLQFSDLSYILPWGDIAEQGPPGVATEGLPLSQHIASHPAMRIPWELWTNKNIAFSGDIVRPEDQQSALRTGWAWTKYLQKQLQPNMMPPFGYGFEAMAKPLWSKVDPEYRGHLDYSGLPRVLPQATLGAIGGIKITPIDPEEELDRTLDGIDGQIQELKKRQNIISRDERMTDAQRDTQIERIDAQIDSLYEKKDQY